MNEQQLRELNKLVKLFERKQDAESYAELAQFIEARCPGFRELYHLVTSNVYFDWSASE